MFQKIFLKIQSLIAERKENSGKPWGKKQKVIFLSFFCALIIYVVVSMIISGKVSDGQGFSLPSLNLSVNGLDVVLLCILGIGFAVLKIRAYIKHRKGNGK